LLEGGIEDETINKDYLLRAAKNVERLQTIVEDLEIMRYISKKIPSVFFQIL
jgi:hypothetical protein